MHFYTFFIYLKALLTGREDVSPVVSLIEPAVGGLDGSVVVTMSSVSAMLESLSTFELQSCIDKRNLGSDIHSDHRTHIIQNS